MDQTFNSFAEFYPFYLDEHKQPMTRRLHFFGTSLVIVFFHLFLFTFDWRMLVAIPIAGYGFAWVGHFFFERNRPATFKHPVYSLMGDFVMFKDILTGKIQF